MFTSEQTFIIFCLDWAKLLFPISSSFAIPQQSGIIGLRFRRERFVKVIYATMSNLSP
jgi:hypothetical protein